MGSVVPEKGAGCVFPDVPSVQIPQRIRAVFLSNPVILAWLWWFNPIIVVNLINVWCSDQPIRSCDHQSQTAL